MYKIVSFSILNYIDTCMYNIKLFYIVIKYATAFFTKTCCKDIITTWLFDGKYTKSGDSSSINSSPVWKFQHNTPLL